MEHQSFCKPGKNVDSLLANSPMCREVYDYIEQCIPASRREKYMHSGIYCLKYRDEILYVGKSDWMLWRIASHACNSTVEWGKEYNRPLYKSIRYLRLAGLPLSFDVLEYCTEDELSAKERKYIGELNPPLNTRRPLPNGKEHNVTIS